MKQLVVPACCVLLLACAPRPSAAQPAAAAPAAALDIGGRAPAIDVAEWIHPGTSLSMKPFTAFEPGKIYVLEFWATWCEYSREAVPLLSSLQRKYAGDVVVIAVAVDNPDMVRGFLSESDPDVRNLAAQAGTYCIVADPDGSVYETFMDAVGENGLPTAFVIGRQGMIEWIGQPMDIEEPLAQIVDGSWNREAFAKQWARIQASRQVVGEIAALIGEKQADEAAAILDRFAADHAADAMVLNEAAWMLVERADYATVPAAVLAAAERSAIRSATIEPDNGNTLDTIAHLQALQGRVDEAIATQRRAVALGGKDVGRFRAYLERLEAGSR